MALSMFRFFTSTSRCIHICARNVHISNVRRLPLIQFKLSDIGEGIAEVQVKEWHVNVGDEVSEFDNLCEVQSDKANVTITSRYNGIIKKLYYEVDDIAKVGKPLLDIEVEGGESSNMDHDPIISDSEEKAKHAQNVIPQNPLEDCADQILATPAVRKIAMENKVDLSQVRGTGKDGRILKEDVLTFIGEIAGKTKNPAPLATSNLSDVDTRKVDISPLETFESLKTDRKVPIRGYTRVMVKTMTEALKIPHFGYSDEIIIDRLIAVRSELKAIAKENSSKLSYLPFFIKAASLALNQFPNLNAVVDECLENVIHKAAHNICIAMDTRDGLVVPNIKNCEQRNVWEIAEELGRLQEAGKRQQIKKEDLDGGTFTLSNIGAIGGTYVSPIIFSPQVVIGALSKIQRLPRYDQNGNLCLTNVMIISWAADHRVVDGATVARFSNVMKAYIENPYLMIAELR